MKLNQNRAFWTSAILHIVVLTVVFLATLIELLLPKEQPHVFEMVSESVLDERMSQNSSSVEPLPDFDLPKVEPLEMPEPLIPSPPQPVKPVAEKPVPAPVSPRPVEKRMTYEEFLKENPIKPPKPQVSRPASPRIKVPTINAEKFGVNLQSSLTTADASTSSTLTLAERTALQRYGNELNGRLNRSWLKPDNLSGISMVATVVFDVSSSGYISNVRLIPGSGNASFDNSVKAAFAKVGSAGATPTGQNHTFTMSFKMTN